MLRVMLADQDVIERRQAVEIVEESGCTVVGQAGSQPEAWEQLEKLWPDVIIADTSRNGVDGLTLARGLSEREHPIVVVLTGRSSDHQLLLQAMRYGAIAFLPKPWKRDEVSDALRRASKLAGYYRAYHTQYGHIYQFLHRLGSLTVVDMLQEQQQLVQGLLRNVRTADEAEFQCLRELDAQWRLLFRKHGITYSDLLPEREADIVRHFQRMAEHWAARTNMLRKHNARLLIQRAGDYIHAHYHEELTLSELSERYGMSISYFSAQFKRGYGYSFVDYVNQVRIQKSKELLLNPSLKVYEVAHAAGYTTLQYFNRVFKQIVNMTPLEYRKQFGI
ncbi:AraC family transcriptional regulator [Paenibacillus alvei TS-15]|jgi:two-component system, response regulator YesN|uniref:AraC family transcriptional regulator n=1 Tax=Paenibacillus alvei TS-15 TaxID=1117108 RepID=S9UDG6_PAEAL|nr:helix-turn-helix domain-containing protein [Paenibacillus alvei]EPY08510.1 AraC family transcriptional regulator [Paenibacillus alvei TS-15]